MASNVSCSRIEDSNCSGIAPRLSTYADRYDDASAVWVMVCAILMFFMKAGFLYIEQAFAESETVFRRRVVLAKYLDTFGSTLGFFFFGFAISIVNNGDVQFLGENSDYVFWFFRFTFASNTATILGGLLVGNRVQLRAVSVFIYAFAMSGFIHPLVARMAWAVGPEPNAHLVYSPFRYCNGTPKASLFRSHSVDFLDGTPEPRILFLDFAGSGVVHLLGGMAGFILAFFHKLELKWRGPSDIYEKCCRKQGQEQQDEASGTGAAAASIDNPSVQQEVESQDQVKMKCGFFRRCWTFRGFLDWMYPSGGGGENVESAALGVLILWTTWFGFNAGSTESITDARFHAVVGRIALVMAVAAASGGLTSTIISGMVQIFKRDEAFNTNEIANGVLACLVAVTGCCAFIDPLWALPIGVLTVIFYHAGCWLVYVLKLHDGARIFPVHAISGFWGLLCVGLFYEKCLVVEIYDNTCFCEEFLIGEMAQVLDSRGHMFVFQFMGGVIIICLAILLCGCLFLCLWMIPVMAVFYATGLKWLFRFSDKERGEITFKGNILFTHGDEIGYNPFPTRSGTVEMQNMQAFAKSVGGTTPKPKPGGTQGKAERSSTVA